MNGTGHHLWGSRRKKNYLFYGARFSWNLYNSTLPSIPRETRLVWRAIKRNIRRPLRPQLSAQLVWFMRTVFNFKHVLSDVQVADGCWFNIARSFRPNEKCLVMAYVTYPPLGRFSVDVSNRLNGKCCWLKRLMLWGSRFKKYNQLLKLHRILNLMTGWN